MLFDFFIIGLMILLNGIFAMAELAVVAARTTRLRTLADGGEKRATLLLKIRESPGDFLATIQIGITLAATTASVVGGAEAAILLSPIIAKIQFLQPYSDAVSLVVIVVILSYFTIVFGELVPKKLAMRNADKIALQLIRPIRFFSRLTHLPKRVLSLSSGLVLRLIGAKSHQEPDISSEEIETIIKQGAADGAILPIEELLINQVFIYADQTVHDVLTPRSAVVGFDKQLSLTDALEEAKRFGFSRYPIYDKQIDNILGYVHIKDLIWGLDKNVNLERCVRETIFIPGNATLPEAFTKLTSGGKHLMIVIDEYGGVEGIVTIEDLLEVVFGEIEDEHSPVAQQPEQSSEIEWIIAGSTLISEISDLLGIEFQPKGRYKTIAGFINTELGYIPSEGDQLKKFGYIFTVQTKDHLRIVNVHILQIKKTKENIDG